MGMNIVASTGPVMQSKMNPLMPLGMKSQILHILKLAKKNQVKLDRHWVFIPATFVSSGIKHYKTGKVEYNPSS